MAIFNREELKPQALLKAGEERKNKLSAFKAKIKSYERLIYDLLYIFCITFMPIIFHIYSTLVFLEYILQILGQEHILKKEKIGKLSL